MSNNKRPKLDQKMLLDSILRKKDGKGEITAQQEQMQPTDGDETTEQLPKLEPTSRKRTPRNDYNDTFLKRNEIKTRQCVYINKSVHEKILKIVNVIADNNVTVGGYIDLVLSLHLDENKVAINELYRQDRTNLID